MKGFFLRVYPSGQKTFALKYRVDGRQKVYTIGKFGSPWTVEQARDRASALLYAAQPGADPQTRKQQLRHSHTVAELVEVYLKEGPKDKPNKRKRRWDNDTLHLNRHVIPLIGAIKAHAVTPVIVADLQGRNEESARFGRAYVATGVLHLTRPFVSAKWNGSRSPCVDRSPLARVFFEALPSRPRRAADLVSHPLSEMGQHRAVREVS